MSKEVPIAASPLEKIKDDISALVAELKDLEKKVLVRLISPSAKEIASREIQNGRIAELKKEIQFLYQERIRLESLDSTTCPARESSSIIQFNRKASSHRVGEVITGKVPKYHRRISI